MPQKKKPDSLELVRGKTGRLMQLMALLTTVKGCLDLQQRSARDKSVFDTIDTLQKCSPSLLRINRCKSMQTVCVSPDDGMLAPTWR